MKYAGKTVFIPGGTQGIGKAIAALLAAKGANIAVFSRSKKNVDAALADIKAHCIHKKQHCEGFALDITDYAKVKTVFKAAIKKIGEPDILLNLAGFAYPDYFENISIDQFRAMMEVNYFGIVNTVHVLLPILKKKERAWIVNTSSQAGYLPVFGYSGYVPTKYAVIGFSEVLKSELLGTNVNVSVLCPPDTETPGFEKENETKPAETIEISKAGKVLTAEQVAKEFEKGFRKGKFLIIPGFDGKLALLVKRFAPWILNMMFNSAIKKARKNKQK